MSPRVTVIAAAVAVVLALLAGGYLLLRAARPSTAPVSAATTVAQTPIPASTQAATPTAAAPTAPPATSRPTAAPTAAPTGQTILSYNVPQTVKCDAADVTTPMVHLTWTTVNATGVFISIDGPGKYADYAASGSADVPFACSVSQHTYEITTEGTGTPVTRTVVVKRA
jgi:hypothetical protein